MPDDARSFTGRTIADALGGSVAGMVFLVPALYLVIHSPAREQECGCKRGMENVEK